MTLRTAGEILAGYEARLPYLINRAQIANRVENAADKGTRFDALRDFYECVEARITSSPAHRWAIDPYAVDWGKVFSPIEWALWCEMRNIGAVLYPQYPIGRYFADFANPIARVVIECDGAAWHTNKAADATRQAYLEARGWTVYRITGAACLSEEYTAVDDDGHESHVSSAALEFVERIAMEHALSCRFVQPKKEPS